MVITHSHTQYTWTHTYTHTEPYGRMDHKSNGIAKVLNDRCWRAKLSAISSRPFAVLFFSFPASLCIFAVLQHDNWLRRLLVSLAFHFCDSRFSFNTCVRHIPAIRFRCVLQLLPLLSYVHFGNAIIWNIFECFPCLSVFPSACDAGRCCYAEKYVCVRCVRIRIRKQYPSLLVCDLWVTAYDAAIHAA